MKSKILKNIIICFFMSFILGILIHHIFKGTATGFDIYVFFSIQLVLSIVNLSMLFVNNKNYYYLGNILFFLPQILTILFLSTQGDYWEYLLHYCYIPFFIVQFFFFFKVKKIFSDIEN